MCCSNILSCFRKLRIEYILHIPLDCWGDFFCSEVEKIESHAPVTGLIIINNFCRECSAEWAAYPSPSYILIHTTVLWIYIALPDMTYSVWKTLRLTVKWHFVVRMSFLIFYWPKEEYLYIFYFHWLWGLCILTIIL